MMFRRCWPLVAMILSACATEPPAGLSKGPFAEIAPRSAQAGDGVGKRVRWGGTIASVSPGRNETCFQVVSRPLASSARPEEGDKTEGRFIACAPGFYDPVVYASGRELTVTGILQTPELGRIGEYEYRFPKVQAEAVYLWPPREPADRPVYLYAPFWHPPGTWMTEPW